MTPTLLDPPPSLPDWFPARELADQVVLLVVDGLGWDQLQERAAHLPTVGSLAGGPILTVAPSTTASALTSICTGLPPGQHGVIGYRMSVEGEVLNVLRWCQGGKDARAKVPPEKIQPMAPFLGHRPAVVTRAEFRESGFTQAHLEGVRFNGYRMPSTLVTEVGRLLRSGESFVYAYYEGIDKVAHEYGLGRHFDAELRAVDRLVADIMEELPAGVMLVVTSDHGQVQVGDRVVRLAPEVMANVAQQSGEGRFRWLHAATGSAQALEQAAREHHSDTAWVVSLEQTIDEGWFGPVVTEPTRARLGDVALVAREPVAYFDPADSGPYQLISRHGSLTGAEMRVPLLAFTR